MSRYRGYGLYTVRSSLELNLLLPAVFPSHNREGGQELAFFNTRLVCPRESDQKYRGSHFPPSS